MDVNSAELWGFNKDFWDGYCWIPDNLGNWLSVSGGGAAKYLKGAGAVAFGGAMMGLGVAQLVCQYLKK